MSRSATQRHTKMRGGRMLSGGSAVRGCLALMVLVKPAHEFHPGHRFGTTDCGPFERMPGLHVADADAYISELRHAGHDGSFQASPSWGSQARLYRTIDAAVANRTAPIPPSPSLETMQ